MLKAAKTPWQVLAFQHLNYDGILYFERHSKKGRMNTPLDRHHGIFGTTAKRPKHAAAGFISLMARDGENFESSIPISFNPVESLESSSYYVGIYIGDESYISYFSSIEEDLANELSETVENLIFPFEVRELLDTGLAGDVPSKAVFKRICSDVVELIYHGRIEVKYRNGFVAIKSGGLAHTLAIYSMVSSVMASTRPIAGMWKFVQIRPGSIKTTEEFEKEETAMSSPNWFGNHYLQDDFVPIVPVLSSVVESGGKINVLVSGPSGYGKTSTMKVIASSLGLDYLRVNCSVQLDTESWFGERVAEDGSTFFRLSPFAEAVKKGNCLILLDEANRIEPWISNSLFPLLDFEGETIVAGEKITVGPGTIFAFTVNEGYQYAGTSVMDAAFRNRIDISLTVTAPEASVEIEIIAKEFPTMEKSDKRTIVGLINRLRRLELEGVDFSVRTSLKVARLAVSGLTLRQAFQYTVINSSPSEVHKGIEDTINPTLGGFSVENK